VLYEIPNPQDSSQLACLSVAGAYSVSCWRGLVASKMISHMARCSWLPHGFDGYPKPYYCAVSSDPC